MSSKRLQVLFRANTFDGGDSVVRFKVEWDKRPSFDSAVDPATGVAIPAGWVTLTVPISTDPRDLRSYIIPDAPPKDMGIRYPASDADAALEEGQTYYVRVFAYNSAGRYSIPAPTAPISVVASGLPDSPSSVQLAQVSGSDSRVSLSWLRPPSGGDAIHSYIISRYLRRDVAPHEG